ncbi:hypothetical protein [Sporosarcina sp. P33]|uniref:hypothetical protein n=1 Tax=Sporosarcina sp. P33 TaxID=1930764 RepID=UPI0018C8D2FD|nr:hypothetical protein [Sporosarcina sp. P33]
MEKIELEDGITVCIARPSQLIVAAGEGSMAAIAVNAALIKEKFNEEKQHVKNKEEGSHAPLT